MSPPPLKRTIKYPNGIEPSRYATTGSHHKGGIGGADCIRTAGSKLNGTQLRVDKWPAEYTRRPRVSARFDRGGIAQLSHVRIRLIQTQPRTPEDYRFPRWGLSAD